MVRHCTKGEAESTIPRWEQDYHLQPFSNIGLFYEYLEMGKKHLIQSLHVPHFQLHTSCTVLSLNMYETIFMCLSLPVSFSNPVWLRDPVCGLLPSGTSPGSGEQCV